MIGYQRTSSAKLACLAWAVGLSLPKNKSFEARSTSSQVCYISPVPLRFPSKSKHSSFLLSLADPWVGFPRRKDLIRCYYVHPPHISTHSNGYGLYVGLSVFSESIYADNMR